MRGVIENNGALVYSPNPSDSESPGITYGRILTLRHNGEENGTLLATCDLTTLFDGHQVWPIFRSADHGVTWERISDMWDSTTGFTRQMNPFLFELPQQMGDLAAGTLLLAGNLKPDDESTTNIMIFYSTDMGITWTHLSNVDSGGPAIYDKSPESTTTAVWEPYLAISNSGDLVCYYSDERQKDNGILQAQVQKISTDGGRTWGVLQNVVGIPNRSDRPGMITMAKLPNGNRLVTYEVVNRPSVEVDGAPIYFKTSPDGVTWDSEYLGTPILLEDGRGIGSSPYVIWVDDGTENGLVVVGSKWALDANGTMMQGQNFYVNRNQGEGCWEKLPMPVVFDSLDDIAYLTGLSMSMETDIDNKVIYQAVNVQNAETNLNDLRIGAIPIKFTNYEAENATLTDVRLVDHYDASNDQKVGDINFTDSSIVFTNVEVETPGDYTILIRYDNGSGADCIHQYIVNDGDPQSIVYPPTKDWGRYGWKMVVTYLKAGTNKIELSYSEGFTEIDCIWKQVRDFQPLDKGIIAEHTAIFEAFMQVVDLVNTPESGFYILDPFAASPLTALAFLQTTLPTSISVRVAGLNSPSDDITYDFADGTLRTKHAFSILGLSAMRDDFYDNSVYVTATTEAGSQQTYLFTIRVDPLPDNIGEVDVIVPSQNGRLKKDLYHTFVGSGYPSGIDLYGNIRWFIKESHTDFDSTMQGNSWMIQLQNGHFIGRHKSKLGLVEYDRLGRIYNIFDTSYFVHHDFIQLPNGDLLLQSGQFNDVTMDDGLEIIDINNGERKHYIDFGEIFDVGRPMQPHTPPPEIQVGLLDWWHENHIDFDLKTNIYVTSSRHQNAVVATDRNTNAIRWILGATDKWGEEYLPYILTPVDSEGNPLYDLTDPENRKRADYEFYNWAQHSTIVLPDVEDDGIVEIMIFNNGAFRSYVPDNWIVPYENWSAADHYLINESNMTVKLLWSYGKELGQDYYSSYVGTVEYTEETNSVMINFGGTNMELSTGRNRGIYGEVPMFDFTDEDYSTSPILEKAKMQEVDYDTKDVLYEFHHYNNETGLFLNSSYKIRKYPTYPENTTEFTSMLASSKLGIDNGPALKIKTVKFDN